MKQEYKDKLLQLLQQHKELGISEQIDYDKFYLYLKSATNVGKVDFIRK